MVVSDKERQRKRREELKKNYMKQIYVRGDGGEYDERIRVALGIKNLAESGQIPYDILELIISASVDAIPAKDKINKIYLTKLIKKYLERKREEIE